MAWIFVDKEGENDHEMRTHMRRNMRGGGKYRFYGGGNKRGYEVGYRHGWEDSEDDDEMDYRRQRDSRGRYV